MLEKIKDFIKKTDSKKIAIYILGLVILWFASGVFRSDSSEASLENINKNMQIPKFDVVESIAENRTQKIMVYGVLEANKTVDLMAQTTGIIKSVTDKEGLKLDKGENILKIELDNRVNLREKYLSILKEKQLKYEVTQKLFRSGHKSETDLAEALANLKSAKADLSQVQLDIEYTNVKAPFDGILEKIYVKEGDLVQANNTKIARLIDTNSLIVTGQVSEKYISLIELGKLTIIQTIDGLEYAGYIKYVGSIADPKTRTFTVEIELKNNEDKLKDGMSAKIEVPAGQVLAHLISPSILTLDAEGDIGIKSLEKDKNGKQIVRFHKVNIIEDEENGFWVSGLPEKISIITNGQAFLQIGNSYE